MERRAPLTLALLARDGRLPGSVIATLQALAKENFIQLVAAAPALAPPSHFHERRERWLAAAQRLLEGCAGASTVALAEAFPALPAAPTGEVDLVFAWDLGLDAALAWPSRLGVLRLEVGGSFDGLGCFRALLQTSRHVPVVAKLCGPGGTQTLAHALPALPDHPKFLTQEAAVHSRSGALLSKVLRQLAARTLPEAGPVPEAPVLESANVLRHATFLAQRFAESLAGRWRKARRSKYWMDDENNWFLAWRTAPERFTCNRESFDTSGFQLLFPPPGRFYADPCVVHVAGRDHVFFEEWRQETGRGVIAHMVLGDDGRLTAPEAVLEEPHHLSYPFVFEADGEVYMIPETAAAGRIDLYCATEFPHGWEKVATLLEGVHAADTTLHRQGGRWWMFTSVGTRDTSKNDTLEIYHSESLTGPWQPHAANPVKIDAASARPAGRLFYRGGKLVRPSQDCTTAYGAAVTLNEITCLTPERFSESVLERIGPEWLPQNVGFHTVAHGRRLEVIDGRIRSKASRFPDLAEIGAYLADATPRSTSAA